MGESMIWINQLRFESAHPASLNLIVRRPHGSAHSVSVGCRAYRSTTSDYVDRNCSCNPSPAAVAVDRAPRDPRSSSACCQCHWINCHSLIRRRLSFDVYADASIAAQHLAVLHSILFALNYIGIALITVAAFADRGAIRLGRLTIGSSDRGARLRSAMEGSR